MTLRPYEVLCAVCRLGGAGERAPGPRSEELLRRVGGAPDMPLALRCNVGEVFAYQDPGTDADSPGGAEFNLRRDLEILHRLNLPPGAVLPARIVLCRVLDRIQTPEGICAYGQQSAEAWGGCPLARSGHYERGREKGIEAIIPPRDEAEMKREKEESLEAMHAAEAIRVRPHILLCSLCQYGGGTRPPFPEDNLPELVQLVLREPERRIELAPHADWMMCAPCPYRAPECDGCINNRGPGGLPNQMRDLRVLQRLGLRFGESLEARELYARIFRRIPGTLEVCGTEHDAPSVWYSGCGAATEDSEAYAKGRRELAEMLGVSIEDA